MMSALVLTMVASALAQEIVDDKIAPVVATPEYRPLVAEFARCIAARDRGAASDFALRKHVEWTSIGRGRIRKLLDKDCVPSRATPEQAKTLKKMTPEMLRPAIADALVRTEFPTSNATLITTAQALPNSNLVESLWPSDMCEKGCGAEQRKKLDETRVRMSAIMAPYVFAECAVRTDPANSHKLLMADVDTAGETVAFAALAPAFGQCVADDAKINSSRTVLRGLLALSYYRLAHAPRAAAAAGVTK